MLKKDGAEPVDDDALAVSNADTVTGSVETVKAEIENKIERRKEIRGYIVSGLLMYVYVTLFSLLGFILWVDAIPCAVKILLSLVFIAPSWIALFFSGKSSATKIFNKKRREATRLSSESGKKLSVMDTKFPYYKSALHCLTFAVPLLIILIVGIAINNTYVHGVVQVIFMSVAVIFTESGIIQYNPISWISLAVYIPTILLYCSAFISGYIIQIKVLQAQQLSIEAELRMFEG